MNWIAILEALGVLGAIGLVFGLLLGVAAEKFHVEQDERIEKIRAHLGGANCGACGYAGCDAFAAAVVEGKAKPTGCPASGLAGAKAIGEIMGIAVEAREPMVAVVLCQGGTGIAKDRYTYEGGVKSCRAVVSMSGGFRLCTSACIGLGDCLKVCKFGGISIVNGIARVNSNECKACGECVNECPRGAITLVPRSATVQVRCQNKSPIIIAKDECQKACMGCKRCLKECESGALSIVDNHAVIDYSLCTHCGACAKVCPRGCIIDKNS